MAKEIITVTVKQTTMVDALSKMRLTLTAFNKGKASEGKCYLPSLTLKKENKKYHVSAKKGLVTKNEHGYAINFGSVDNSLKITLNSDCIFELCKTTDDKKNNINPLFRFENNNAKTSTDTINFLDETLGAGLNYLKARHLDTCNLNNLIAEYKRIVWQRVNTWLATDEANGLGASKDSFRKEWEKMATVETK